MRAHIIRIMQSMGLDLILSQPNNFWFGKSRDFEFTDVYCFEITNSGDRFGVSFGLENTIIRNLSILAAERIFPRDFSAAESLLRLTQRPSINMFNLPVEFTAKRRNLIHAEVNVEAIERVDQQILAPVVTESKYLEFLGRKDGTFDWACSVVVFRILYLGWLFRRCNRSQQEFEGFVSDIPKKSIENHIYLRSSKMTANEFIAASIKWIWA